MVFVVIVHFWFWFFPTTDKAIIRFVLRLNFSALYFRPSKSSPYIDI